MKKDREAKMETMDVGDAIIKQSLQRAREIRKGFKELGKRLDLMLQERGIEYENVLPLDEQGQAVADAYLPFQNKCGFVIEHVSGTGGRCVKPGIGFSSGRVLIIKLHSTEDPKQLKAWIEKKEYSGIEIVAIVTNDGKGGFAISDGK